VPESKNIFFVSEILGELPSTLASDVCDALKNGILKYFDINAKTAILDQQNHFVEVQN
jgi:hypothetical protein